MKISYIANTLKEIVKLPKVKLSFSNIENNRATYNYFTKRHRFKVIRNKTIGVALIDISLYKNFDEYYKAVNGKNSAAYYARKATKRNYRYYGAVGRKIILGVDLLCMIHILVQVKA